MYELRKKCLDDYLNERVVGMYDTEYIQTASGELVLQRKKKNADTKCSTTYINDFQHRYVFKNVALQQKKTKN